jgi:hypothetical protein
MKIPFSMEDFLNVFGRYNTDVWPIHIVFYFLAVLSMVLVVRAYPKSNQFINAILSFFWIWMGIVYHILYFSSINPVAVFFGALFIVQGILFAYVGTYKNDIRYEFRSTIFGITGILFIAYGLVIYPLLSYAFGHVYPQAPTFGLPCPTTIYTFGVLLLSRNKIPWYILVIPFLWSLIGFSASVNLSVKEDYALVVAGILATGMLLFKQRSTQGSA